MLHNLARNLARSRQETDDIVQETYLRALQAWPRTRPEQVRPWLATICLNVVRAAYRYRQARAGEVLDSEPGVAVAAAADTADQALTLVTRHAVERALRGLPPPQREAVVLMDLCRFTAAEVAELTGAPRGTVLARAHRGRKKLARLLDNEAVHDG